MPPVSDLVICNTIHFRSVCGYTSEVDGLNVQCKRGIFL
jgi:hypothetical protein